MVFMKSASAIVGIGMLVAAVSASCDKGGGGGGEFDPAAQAEAAKLYMERCSTCHGQTGTGDGSGAANLNPKPRNFQDPSWQSSVDDAHIEKIILLGGTGAGKSAAMPANPDLSGKDAVVKALRAKVRGFKP